MQLTFINMNRLTKVYLIIALACNNRALQMSYNTDQLWQSYG